MRLRVTGTVKKLNFLVNPLYETSPEWHGFLMIKLAASAASGWADT
jgi:hypothetical protein